MVKSYSRGHIIIFIKNEWVYKDNKLPITDIRACKKCGKFPTQNGHDACIGNIKGARSACCGHGVINPFVKW